MQYLPEPEERKWLTHYLRRLIERAGWQHFVSAPLLEPARNWFPEPWSGSVRDAHIVTQRLMHYAGIGRLKPHLEGYESMTDEEDGEERFDWAAWFTHIANGRAHFGIQYDTLDDPEKAAGTMAHEVAHAWREHHKLIADSRDREELLTDITTVYLGFGIFTTNNTDRYRSEGDMQQTRWSFSRVGYLPMQAMAYLLALQATARDDLEETAKIERHLEANQQRAFREAMELLEGEDILELLSLPPRLEWPDIERKPHRIEVYEPSADEAFEEPGNTDDPQRNASTWVYRQRADSSSTLTIVVIAGTVLVAASVVTQGLDGVTAMTIIVALVGAAGYASSRFRRYVCSDPDCHHRLTADVAACPGCGGIIAPNAEEALERNAAGSGLPECSECEPEEPCSRHA